MKLSFPVLQECPPGFYTNTTGASECDICPAGQYCLPVQPHNASLNAQECPPGYFCPAGTGLDWESCPAGTFSAQTALYEQSQCTACPAGRYCQGQHQTNYTGDCNPGMYMYIEDVRKTITINFLNRTIGINNYQQLHCNRVKYQAGQKNLKFWSILSL